MASRSSTSSFASTVNFESLLEKRSKLPGSFLSKKYWCVLDDGKLTYYKDAKKNMAVDGVIDISQIQSVMRSQKSQTFSIITSATNHSFTAATYELREQWVKALQDAMSVCNRKQSVARQSMLGRTSVNRSFDSEEPPRTPVSPTGSLLYGSQAAQTSPIPAASPPAVSPLPQNSCIKSSAPTDHLSSESRDKSGAPVSTESVEAGNKSRPETSASAEFDYVNAEDVLRALDSRTSPAAPAGEPQKSRVESHLTDNGNIRDANEAEIKAQAQQETNKISSCPVASQSIVSHVEPTIEEDVEAVDITSVPSAKPDMVEPPEELPDISQAEETGDHLQNRDQMPDSEVPTLRKIPEVDNANESPTTKTACDKPARMVTMRPQSRQPSDAAPPPEKDSKPAATVIEIRVEDFDFKPLSAVELPNPKLDGDVGLAFDQLRTFLDKNCHKSNHAGPAITQSGQAIESLKYFLANLD